VDALKTCQGTRARDLASALALSEGLPGRSAWAPAIVLTYPHSGAERLLALLSAGTDLACTGGTGLVPLLEQAAAVWRRAEAADDQPGTIPPAAGTPIRALISAMATRILASAGRERWCELLPVSRAPAAETFLSAYPATRFLCLHRGFSDVARAAMQANPWGLAGPVYSPYIAAHPGSTITALADYWATQTEALLAFEYRHPQACLRIRFEDLAEVSAQASQDIACFLGVDDLGGHPAEPAPESADPWRKAHVPADQIPPLLLAQVNDLMRRLGYTT
jgi:Sulfotransferase family